MSESDPSGVDGQQRLVCDFCGQEVPRVRRVALDEDYDRLQTPHPVQFACDLCSRKKEEQRLGLDRG
jgi:hypothetical protein